MSEPDQEPRLRSPEERSFWERAYLASVSSGAPMEVARRAAWVAVGHLRGIGPAHGSPPSGCEEAPMWQSATAADVDRLFETRRP